MQRGQLLGAETRLYDLNVFDWSSVGPRKPITDQTVEETLIKVHESKRNEITYGFGFEVSHRGGNIPTEPLPFPGEGQPSAWEQPDCGEPVNLRQSAGVDRVYAQKHARSCRDCERVDSSFTPRSAGDYQLFAAAFFWLDVEFVDQSFHRTYNGKSPLRGKPGGHVIPIGKLLSRKTNTRLQFRYDFNKTILSQLLVPELVLPQDRNVHLSTLSSTLIRDTRDKPLDAHKGIFLYPEFCSYSRNPSDPTPALQNSSGSMLSTSLFIPLCFANSVRLGLAKAFNGSFVPTSQLYFSGGGTSLRAFPIDEAGPQRLVPFCNVLAAANRVRQRYRPRGRKTAIHP